MGQHFDRPSRGYGSYNSAINGVSKYVNTHHPKLIQVQNKDANKWFSQLAVLMQTFLESIEVKHKKKKSFSASDFNANLVQDNWKAFKEWLKDLDK